MAFYIAIEPAELVVDSVSASLYFTSEHHFWFRYTKVKLPTPSRFKSIFPNDYANVQSYHVARENYIYFAHSSLRSLRNELLHLGRVKSHGAPSWPSPLAIRTFLTL